MATTTTTLSPPVFSSISKCSKVRHLHIISLAEQQNSQILMFTLISFKCVAFRPLPSHVVRFSHEMTFMQVTVKGFCGLVK
jgi:hypothetical protein